MDNDIQDIIKMKDSEIKFLTGTVGRLHIQNKKLIALMQTFVERVEAGSIRSVSTYAAFKQAIKENE